MKYVVFQSGGKQYKAAEGEVLELEQLDSKENEKINFGEVLLYTNDGTVKVGSPYVNGVSVEGLVVKHMRGDKIRVMKYKAKSRYRKVIGHRQSLTQVKIETITESKEKKTDKIESK